MMMLLQLKTSGNQSIGQCQILDTQRTCFFYKQTQSQEIHRFGCPKTPQVVTAVAPMPHAFETVVLSSYEGGPFDCRNRYEDSGNHF